MNRPLATASRPQLALQSYLDSLLQEAAVELADSITLDEFEAAVLEEQVRDARAVPQVQAVAAKPLAELAARPLVLPTVEIATPPVELRVEIPPPVVEAAAVLQVEQAPLQQLMVPETELQGRPEWAQGPFECLLFDVAGLTLAVPLVCLGSIYPLARPRTHAIIWPTRLVSRHTAEPGRQLEGAGYCALGDA